MELRFGKRYRIENQADETRQRQAWQQMQTPPRRTRTNSEPGYPITFLTNEEVPHLNAFQSLDRGDLDIFVKPDGSLDIEAMTSAVRAGLKPGDEISESNRRAIRRIFEMPLDVESDAQLDALALAVYSLKADLVASLEKAVHSAQGAGALKNKLSWNIGQVIKDALYKPGTSDPEGDTQKELKALKGLGVIRKGERPARYRPVLAKLFESLSPDQVDALTLAIPRLKGDILRPFAQILVKDKQIDLTDEQIMDEFTRQLQKTREEELNLY